MHLGQPFPVDLIEFPELVPDVPVLKIVPHTARIVSKRGLQGQPFLVALT